MFKSIVFFVLSINFLFAIFPETKKEIENTLFTSFTIDTIQDLSSEANGNRSLEEDLLTDFVKNLSNKFRYEIETAKLQDKQIFGNNYLNIFRDPKRIDVNKNRIKFQQYKFEMNDAKIVYDFPNMFFLYKRLAELASENFSSGNFQYFKSGFYYNRAMQFRCLKMTLTNFTDLVRNSLQEETQKNIEEAIFINEVLETQKSIKVDKEELKDLLKKIFILKDKNILDYQNIEELEKSKKSVIKKIEEKEKLHQEQLQKYKTYEKDWDEESSTFLLDISNLFHKLEISINSEEVYRKGKKVYPLNLYSIKDTLYTESVQKSSRYVNLLEKAFFLNKNNPEISYLVGTFYRLNQNVDKAIYFYEETIQRSKIENNKFLILPEYIHKSIWYLSNLYLGQRQYTQAIYYYENFLEETKEVENISFIPKDILYFQLLELHVERSGNYKRALELSEMLEKSFFDISFEKMLIEQPDKTILYIKNYFWRAFIFTKNLNNRQASIDNFYRSIELYTEFEEQRKNLLYSIKKRKEELNTLRKENDNIDIEGQQFVLQKEEEIERTHLMFQKLNSLKNQLPLKQMFFGLSEQLMLSGRTKDAKLILEEAQKRSIHSNDAVRKIRKLE